MTHAKKNNTLAIEVGKAYWEAFGEKTRAALLVLLQKGQRPHAIEEHIRATIDRDHPQLPIHKRKEISARYYLAADYALQNNLHLN